MMKEKINLTFSVKNIPYQIKECKGYGSIAKVKD